MLLPERTRESCVVAVCVFETGACTDAKASHNGGKAVISSALWGTSPTFSCWARGTVSTTDNLTYALRDLDTVGNIREATR